MEHFRHIGEVVGSLKARMVLHEDIRINQSQCILLLELLYLAFETIADEIKQINLKSEEKNNKWKVLEQPLRELHRVFKEAELYTKDCLDANDWWPKAVILHQNNDCIEFHIHNLLCYFPAVIEAIENAGDISGVDQNELDKRTLLLRMKYDYEWNDPKLFEWRFGKQYLVPREIRRKLASAWKEDRWRLIDAIRDMRASADVTWTKNEHELGKCLINKLLNGSDPSNANLFPSAILLTAKEYQVRRRLGGGSQYKEIQWFGETFALRQFVGNMQTLGREVSALLSLYHPNIVQYLCGFCDEEKEEFYLVMEMMKKDLLSYMKDNLHCDAKGGAQISLPVVVDLMLQIARGMEYLHSKNICHGNLNPSNVFLVSRNRNEGYFQAKVTGFGLPSLKKDSPRGSTNQNPKQESSDPSYIWYPPEFFSEQEEVKCIATYTEKGDVYSFGMTCFELLTGKIPFEDSHLQGDKIILNIKAGERPLFPHLSPKYLVNLIKRCWQTEPSSRPSFSSICRILRYLKNFLAMNPDHSKPSLHSPPVDLCGLEQMFSKKLPSEGTRDLSAVLQIPFQMFSYKLAEKEKLKPSIETSSSVQDSETELDELSFYRYDYLSAIEDSVTHASETKSICSDLKSVYLEAPVRRSPLTKKSSQGKIMKSQGLPKQQTPRSSPQNPNARIRSSRTTIRGRPLPWT